MSFRNDPEQTSTPLSTFLGLKYGISKFNPLKTNHTPKANITSGITLFIRLRKIGPAKLVLTIAANINGIVPRPKNNMYWAADSEFPVFKAPANAK